MRSSVGALADRPAAVRKFATSARLIGLCPVSAIFPEDAVPDKWKNYIEINKNYFNK